MCSIQPCSSCTCPETLRKSLPPGPGHPMFQTVHGFVQSKVEVAREERPDISFLHGLTAIVAVVLSELTACLCLYFLLVPKPSSNVTVYTVTAKQALAGMDDCDVWTDVTQYPVGGIALPRLSRTIDVRLTGPVTNTGILDILPNLTCVGPTDDVARALGLNIMLSVDAYGWQEFSGQVDSICTHPSVPSLVVHNLVNSWDKSCKAVFGRARAYYDNLLWLYPNVTDSPRQVGIECSILLAKPVVAQFRHFFNWPQHKSRFGFTGWLYVFCDGLPGLQQDFLLNNRRNMTNDEMASLNTTAGLCALSANGTCLRSYRRQKWGKSAEYIRLDPARFACSNILFGYQGRSATIPWAVGCNNPGRLMYFQNFTPPNDTPFEGDPSLAIKMLQDLSAMPEGPSPSIQNMPSSCPGRTSPLLDSVGSKDSTNYNEIVRLLQTYATLQLFSFACTRFSPAKFEDRLSYIFPYMNIVHTIAMTYMIRYLYLGLRATSHVLGGKSKEGATESAGESVEDGLQEDGNEGDSPSEADTIPCDREVFKIHKALDDLCPRNDSRGSGDPLTNFERVLDLISPRSTPRSTRSTPRDPSLRPVVQRRSNQSLTALPLA